MRFNIIDWKLTHCVSDQGRDFKTFCGLRLLYGPLKKAKKNTFMMLLRKQNENLRLLKSLNYKKTRGMFKKAKENHKSELKRLLNIRGRTVHSENVSTVTKYLKYILYQSEIHF